jgi:dUTP pyrophosphatase
MKQVTVQIVNKSRNPNPKYSTLLAAGFDIAAMVDGTSRVMIYPGKICLVHTGLYVAIPDGYELQIRPRSGLAIKQGISIVNTPGTIDADYRGEIGVILINHGEEAVGFANGDRIAQAVLSPVEQVAWIELDKIEDLPKTDRGEDGFGSTGIKDQILLNHTEPGNSLSKDQYDRIVEDVFSSDTKITGDKPDPNSIAETINK